jgi:hypothetical protein
LVRCTDEIESLATAEGEKTISELPTILVMADLEANAGEQARVIGYYTQIDVRMRAEPPPVYNGNVAVVLEDGTKVLLYAIWDVEARRPAAEIAQYENQRVAVEGMVFPQCPDSPDHLANLRLPCLLMVDSIQMAAE